MDHALRVRRARIAAHFCAVEVELLDVVGCDELRTERASNEEVIRRLRIANGDVAERIDDALIGQDAVGDGELARELTQLVRHAPASRRRRLRATPPHAVTPLPPIARDRPRATAP